MFLCVVVSCWWLVVSFLQPCHLRLLNFKKTWHKHGESSLAIQKQPGGGGEMEDGDGDLVVLKTNTSTIVISGVMGPPTNGLLLNG